MTSRSQRVLAIFPTFSCLLYSLTSFTKYETERKNENLTKVAWLTKYYNLMSTSTKIKIAIVPMDKSLVDDGVSSF